MNATDEQQQGPHVVGNVMLVADRAVAPTVVRAPSMLDRGSPRRPVVAETETNLRAALEEAIEVLERVGCQGGSCFCNGPTLEPEPMVTCYLCSSLAVIRVAIGRPPREPGELTWQERHDADMASYMTSATGRHR